MEKHQCKLCARMFNNGRALGGHMKAHMAVLPLPPKTQLAPAESTHSASSYSSSSEDEHQHEGGQQQEEEDQKALAYGLRENPKKSFRLADPEFSFHVDAAGSVVIQDRESETESRNPTRRRSKRNRRMSFTEKLDVMKKPKLTASTVDVDSPPPAEPEPLSSVSDTSPEEDVAMCLMMLSRDVWMRTSYEEEADQEKENGKEVVVVVAVNDEESEQLEEIKSKNKVRGKNRCDKCSKLFRSQQAMCVHRKICFQSEAEANNAAANSATSLFKCPFCSKIFGSGQALGGHKRSHLSTNTTTTTTTTSGYSKVITKVKQVVKQVRESFIDLNMPAPQEEDDFSVVSDA